MNLGIADILQIISIVVVPFCSGIIVFLGWRNNRKTEELKIMQERLNEKKHEAYAKAVSMFFNVLKDTKTNRRQNFSKQMESMTDVKRDIFMYGSDTVFRAFNQWLIYSTDLQSEEVNYKQFNAFLNFVLEIRKDLCGDNTAVTCDEILINLTQSRSEANKLRECLSK